MALSKTAVFKSGIPSGVQPPFSVNMCFNKSKPLMGGDAFLISPLTQFEASFEQSESLKIATVWAALALSAALN